MVKFYPQSVECEEIAADICFTHWPPCRRFISSLLSDVSNSVLKPSEEKIVLITLHQERSFTAGCTNEQILLGGVTTKVWCVDWELSGCVINFKVCDTHCRSSRTPPLWDPSSRWGSSREGWNEGNVFLLDGTACSGQQPPNWYSPQISAGPQRDKDCCNDGSIKVI